MRIVITGAGEISVRTAELLIKRKWEVVIIESDLELIEVLEDKLDCGFLHGDGTDPNILREADPKSSDILMCLTNSDQGNIISSLLGRSLGFDRVVTRIENPEYETICRELELEDLVIPSRTTGLHLADLARDRDCTDFSSYLKDEARLFRFVAGEEDCGKVSDLDLPENCRLICCYRDEKFLLIGDEDKIQKDDEIVLLTDSNNLEALQDRWNPNESGSPDGSE
jgi:trk system potassium uptake protein TrkA